MSLIKNLNTHIKNNGSILTVIVGGAVILTQALIYQVPSASASDTVINTQVCQGGQTTVNMPSTTPANGASINTNHVNYKIQTDWANFLTVKLNGNQVFSQAVAYQAGVETTVPLSNLLPSPQTNTLTIEIKGGCPEQTITRTTQLTFLADVLNYATKSTKNRSPELTGEVNNPDLEVRVRINGYSGFFRAINHRNGRWTLPAGTIAPDLADGTYDIQVESFDLITNQIVQVRNYPNGLRIDNVAPDVTFNPQAEYDNRSPELTGTVNEPNTTIEITINGHTYTATNDSPSSWKLPAGAIKPLANGEYEVIIKATDAAGNVTEIRSHIKINAKNSFGFLIAPNTGYLRIGQTNIPSWLIYLIIIATISTIAVKRKSTAKA